MTNVLPSEQLREATSPYQHQSMPAYELGLPSDVEVDVERWSESITSIERAAETYNTYGAAILAPECVVQIGQEDVRVGEFTAAAGDYVVELLNSSKHEDAIRQKDYEAYNGTERHLYTVSPENVEKHLPDVLEWQRKLLPMVRAINDDPTTEISIDEDEGTVINLQLFDPEADEKTQQQHGAHTDRVDTTTVVCLDNVGPHGELVFVEGYSAVCDRLGLSPHRGFDQNLGTILEQEPKALTFRVHDVRPGTIVMIKSAEDVHFITAKTLGDVKTGADQDHKPRMIGDKWLGRGIINMAFETETCRKVDTIARNVEKKYRIHKQKSTDTFFAKLSQALDSVDPQYRKDVGNAIVTRRSASDLYQ